MVIIPLQSTSLVMRIIIYDILYESILKSRKSKEMIFCIIISLLISIERRNGA